MTDRELMKMALDALQEVNKLSIGEKSVCLPAEIDDAMDALRERLSQPEPDAVLAEREACAKVCEEGTEEPLSVTALKICLRERNRIAKAIRARGEE